MSHQITIKSVMKDRDIVLKALRRMEIIVSSFDNNSITIDKAVNLKREKDETFTVHGDPYYSKQRSVSKYYGKNNKFHADLLTAYNTEETIDVMESQGFYCVQNEKAEVDNKGIIEMVFENYN